MCVPTHYDVVGQPCAMDFFRESRVGQRRMQTVKLTVGMVLYLNDLYKRSHQLHVFV